MTRPAPLFSVRRAAQALCAVLLATSAVGAAAQTVYRCGPDGRTYQTEPCGGGRPVDVADPRSDEQRRAAKEAADADARLAGRLERERRAREAAPPARAGGIGPAAAPGVPSSAPYRYARRHGYPGRYGTRGVRYFPDGTPVPPLYRVPAAARQPVRR